MKNFLTPVLLLLLFVGCKKEDNPSPYINEEDIRVVSITNIPIQTIKESFSKSFSIDPASSSDQGLMREFETNVDNMRPESQWMVTKIVFTYSGVLADGNECTLSGAIFMNWWDYKRDIDQKGIILANHYTIGSNNESPSRGDPYESYLCQLGYIVVMPDYLGFGSTSGVPQAYLHVNSTSIAAVNAFLGVKKALGEAKYEGEIGPDNYNLGYSQGGHTAMAVHKLVQEKYQGKIHFKETIAAGGPYDILKTYQNFVSTNKTGIPAAIPIMVTGMNYAENLKLDYSTVFLPPLLEGYRDWVLSKRYTTDQITKMMGGYNLRVDQILHPNALDASNPQTAKMLAALKRNSLTGGWVPKATTPIYIFHSTTDDVVPIINANAMYDFLRHNNVTPSVEMADYGGHMDAGKLFFARTVLQHIK